MSLRVALVVNRLDFGGTETIVGRLARGAWARGDRVVIVAVRGLGTVGDALRADGLPVISLGVEGGLHGDPTAAVVAAARLGRVLERWHVEILHSFLFEANVVARLAARRCGARVISSFRSNLFRLPYEAWFERASQRWVTSYCAVSDAVGLQASRCLGIARDRIVTIHNGIDLTPAPEPPIAVETLGFLGRLHPERSLDVILRALALLPEPALRLRIAGEGPHWRELLELASGLGLSDRVQFIGQVTAVEPFLDTVDGVVVPGVDGLSNAALEAMARCRPVIANDEGGNRELVRHGVTGLLVPGRRADDWAAAMRQLALDPDPGRFGREGRRRVERDFSGARMVDRTRALWRRALDVPLPGQGRGC